MKGTCYNGGGNHNPAFHYEVDRPERQILCRWLEQGKSVLVTGGRRIGKSVLLNQVAQDLSNPGGTPKALVVFLDLMSCSESLTPVEFFRALVGPLCRSLSAWPELSLRVKTSLESSSWSSPCLTFGDLVFYARDELVRNGIGRLPVLLVLDECEKLLTSSHATTLLGNLRALTGPQMQHCVRLLLSGFRRLHAHCDPTSSTSPLRGVLDELLLGVLGPDEHAALIAPVLSLEPQANRREDLREWLIHQTGGHPCVTQFLAAEIAGGATQEQARQRALERLPAQAFESWLHSFDKEDHARLKNLLRAPLPVAGTISDTFLLFCGVAARTPNNLLAAPCEIFNTWYRTEQANDASPSSRVVSDKYPDVPHPLAEAYAASKVIAFVGSGVSLSQGVCGDFPTWREIGDRLLDHCRRRSLADEDFINPMSAVLKSRLRLKEMLSLLGTIRKRLDRQYRAALLEIFRPKNARPGRLHSALTSMRFRAFLTTNYDELLELSDPHLARRKYTWQQSREALHDIEEDERVLLKVHGSAEVAESVVLTSIEYDRLSMDESYAAVLRFLMQDCTFLFIGYGMNDPLDLDRALESHAIQFHSAARLHYALLHQADDATRERLLTDFNVHVLRYEDHSEVLEFLEALAQGAPRNSDA